MSHTPNGFPIEKAKLTLQQVVIKIEPPGATAHVNENQLENLAREFWIEGAKWGWTECLNDNEAIRAENERLKSTIEAKNRNYEILETHYQRLINEKRDVQWEIANLRSKLMAIEQEREKALAGKVICEDCNSPLLKF